MSFAPLAPNQAERLWILHCYSNLNTLRDQPRQRYIGVGLSSTPGKGKSMTLRKTRLIFSLMLTGLVGVVYAASSTILLGKLKNVEEQDTRQIVKEVWVFLLKTKMTLVLKYAVG